jgi:hypothetical protein
MALLAMFFRGLITGTAITEAKVRILRGNIIANRDALSPMVTDQIDPLPKKPKEGETVKAETDNGLKMAIQRSTETLNR